MSAWLGLSRGSATQPSRTNVFCVSCSFFDGRQGLKRVQVVDVDIISLETTQGVFVRAAQMVARRAAIVRPSSIGK